MNFLSPWFLLGALAVAGPILFHLIRRAAKERMPFSSLMFLSPMPPRITRRRKLEHLWLLLLRCLCLLLLAIGFARPFFARGGASSPAPEESRQIILLVDTSASMRREGLWDQARGLADKYLKRASPGDQVGIVTFDRQPHALVTFAEWSSWSLDQRAALARQRLAASAPGWMDTQLGLALTSAAEQFVEESRTGKPAGRRELVLITDLQEGASLDGLQGHEWPAGVKVILERVQAQPRANAGLEILDEAGTPVSTANEVRVRVANARDSRREKFALKWQTQNGAASAPMEIYLPPGRTRTFIAPRIPASMTTGTLQLTGDEEDFDNQSYYAAPEMEHVKILWFGSESANDPGQLRFYVQRAFPGTARRQVEIGPPPTPADSSAGRLNQGELAVISRQLTPDEIASLRLWLTRGKTALMVLTDTQMGPTLAALTAWPEIQITEAGGNYALLAQIDFTHPLFAPFADPRFSDFSHIHFWKHRRVAFPASAPVRVLAKFDDGSPALTQIPAGRGNLLVLASGWNPADSQLAVSSKFPPLLHTLLDWSDSASMARYQFSTGEAIPSPTSSAGEVQWRRPDGKPETLAAGEPFSGTDLPGIYTASFAGTERRFAVNLPLAESRTAPMSPDDLARLGVPLGTGAEISPGQAAERQRRLLATELENRQKLWRWLVAGVLAVMLGEIILSGRLARRVKTMEAST
ncbi:MAG TPA: BatA domain-containing protein [Candidatus Acidoferrales bacterium]|nr:BatA domain-containing protein [Candidatus Acidoferrales bacterium]